MSEGWLHTGDMAVWDEENYIQIVDRKKDIIITGGENVSSIEVENAICAHAAVLECAVVAAPHPKWGEVVAAIITSSLASKSHTPNWPHFSSRGWRNSNCRALWNLGKNLCLGPEPGRF